MKTPDLRSRFLNLTHYAEGVKLFGPSFGWYRLRQERGLADYPFLPDSDFGRFADKGTQNIASPSTTHEVSELLRQSRARGTHVNICGRHHSMNGQTLARPGGTRLAMDFPFNYRRGADAQGPWAEVPTSVDWFAMESFEREGLAFPVFTTHLSTAIGGTLSVSGVGQHSVNFGRQIDQVLGFELVLPDGSVTWVSEDDEPELFRMTLAGFGLFGVMTKVRLRLIQRKEWVAYHSITFHSFADAWSALVAFCELHHGEGRADTVSMTRDHRYYSLHIGYEFQTQGEARRECETLPPCVDSSVVKSHSAQVLKAREQRRTRRTVLDNLIVGKWKLSQTPSYHPFWNEWVFPDQASARRYSEQVERIVSDPNYAPHYFGLYFLVLRDDPKRLHSPLSLFGPSWPQVPNHLRLGVGTYFHVPMDDDGARRSLESLTIELQKLAHREGGRLYLYTHHHHTFEDLHAHYGQDWEDVVRLKRALDPDLLLNGDVLPFD